MTKEQGEAEVKFRMAKAVFASLHERGLVTDDELQCLLRAACDMYHPIIGELEVESIGKEKGYKG